jgi:Flp pilus assembly protein TadB
MAEKLKLGLGALVAVTCVAVLAVSAVWWQDRSEAEATEQRAKQIATDIRHEKYVSDCKITIKQWEGVQRDAVTKKYGAMAAETVETCRDLLRLSLVTP